MMRRMDVHEAANRRLKIIFDYFDYVYVSFSGGKDSGILLHLCMDYIRMHAPGRKLGVFHMDYEVQYLKCSTVVSPSRYPHVLPCTSSTGVPGKRGTRISGFARCRAPLLP